MKKSRIFSALLVLALLSTCVIGGTFAKYTSSATGSDTARVAKWSIKLNTAQIATGSTEAVTISLFDTIYDSNGTDEETDVAKIADHKIIAPGTSGKFEINILNDSEVNAKYDMTFTTSTAAIPVQFSTDGSDWKTTISDCNLTNQDLDMSTTPVTTTVYWKWEYEVGAAHDVVDTTLGIAAREAAQELTVNVAITATQVD